MSGKFQILSWGKSSKFWSWGSSIIWVSEYTLHWISAVSTFHHRPSWNIYFLKLIKFAYVSEKRRKRTWFWIVSVSVLYGRRWNEKTYQGFGLSILSNLFNLPTFRRNDENHIILKLFKIISVFLVSPKRRQIDSDNVCHQSKYWIEWAHQIFGPRGTRHEAQLWPFTVFVIADLD